MPQEHFPSTSEIGSICKVLGYYTAGIAGLVMERHPEGGVVLTLAAIGLKYASAGMEDESNSPH